MFTDYLTHTVLGKWKQAEPSGCATKCGVAAGKSGTPGAVTCDSLSCDDEEKPDAKQCPKTVDCGAFDTDMSNVNTETLTRTPFCSAPPSLVTIANPSPMHQHMLTCTFEFAAAMLIPQRPQCWVSCQGVLLGKHLPPPRY